MSTYPFRTFYVVLGAAGILIVSLCACLAFSTVGLMYGIRNGAQVSCPNKFNTADFTAAVKEHVIADITSAGKLRLRLVANVTYGQEVPVEVQGDSFCVTNDGLWNIFNFMYSAGWGNGDQFARNEFKTGK